MPAASIRKVFQKNGYNMNSYITRQDFQHVLNSLMMNGQQFHQQVAQQIWNQAIGGQQKNQVKISALCSTIIQARNILQNNLYQISKQMQILKNQIKQARQQGQYKQQQQLLQKINQLQQSKFSFEQDYRLLTQPFGINQKQTDQEIPSINIQTLQKTVPQSQQLKYSLYLILIFGFLQIIMIYGKPDFLNLIVLTCLLSLYLMSFFDKVYIRLTLMLTSISIALDLLWLILYAKSKWNPSDVSNTSVYQVGYTRFIVFFTIILIPLKLTLVFFLAKYRNTEANDKYIVSAIFVKILVKGNNKFNPISKNLEQTAILSQ